MDTYSYQDFDFIKYIGKGVFSDVLKYKHKITVPIKRVNSIITLGNEVMIEFLIKVLANFFELNLCVLI